jgi:tetratricopeptide (TPR) repeat protein
MTELVDDLRQRLSRYPMTTHPVEHATLRFNLGMALAESPHGNHTEHLMTAIEQYAESLRVFTATAHPRERARVLTALGAAERELGRPIQARDRFTEALGLVSVDSAPAEVGAAANGLGLALADLGDREDAIAAYRRAEAAFSDRSRQLAATLHNLGLVLAAGGSPQALTDALEAYRQGLDLVDPRTDGYVWASLHHARAVALMGLPGDRMRHLNDAIRSETAALTVFTRRSHPFQYAIARNNMGVAYTELSSGHATMLRRALVALEEAVTIFDPRLHPEPWQQAKQNLDGVERSLGEGVDFVRDRSAHFATLAAEVSGPERTELLRTRLSLVFEHPLERRTSMLAALDNAIVGLDGTSQNVVTRSWMTVLMEHPRDHVLEALASRQRAHERLDHPQRAIAVRAVEAALGELEVLQRVGIRDTLSSLGYQRPDGS